MSVQKLVATNWGYFPEKYGQEWTQAQELLTSLGANVLEQVLLPSDSKTDLPIFFFKRDGAHQGLKALKEAGFSFLTDYTAVDELGSEDEVTGEGIRFHLVWHLMNPETKCRIRIKVRLVENQEFPSLVDVWPGANWAEREIYDMFGIHFTGHPDLRRILMDLRWEGHPLRKDYPLRGYQVFLTPEPIDGELLK